MFNSPVLDLVILLSFTYFVGSIILSAINEAIAGFLRLRQNQLKEAIEGLFFESGWKTFVRRNLIQSPHLQALMKKKGKFPAYISASSFVLAIIDQIGSDNYKKETLRDSIKASTVLPAQFKTVLLDMFAQAKDNLDEFEKKLGEFYDNVMDRTTGWYRKKTRRILIIAGFILALALNIDTIKIANDALRDPDKLSKAADNITANLSKLDSLRGTIQVADDSVTMNLQEIGQQTAGKVKELKVVYEQTSGYSLGYKNGKDFKEQWSKNFWLKLLGILMTTFALQLSANFWFDLLNKVSNVRSVGKKPAEMAEQTKQPPKQP